MSLRRTPISQERSARPEAPTDEQLVHGYLAEGLSTRQLAARYGVRRVVIAERLHAAGVELPPRGRGRRRADRRWVGPADLPALLVDWYVRERLTSAEIAERLGVAERTVRNRLVEYGIEVRSRGRCNREDRGAVPTEELIELYVDAGLTAAEVADKLGCAARTVLRTAHDLGLAVRIGGPPPAAGPTEIELVEALYADLLVAGVLAAHDIAPVPAGAAIFERFPRPLQVEDQVLRELYVDAGISTRHIELLTGLPATAVARRLHGCGIPLRTPGGRTPFLRRWRRDQSTAGRGRRSSTTDSSGPSGHRTGQNR